MMTTANLFARYRIIGGWRSGRNPHDDAAESLRVAQANKLSRLVQFAEARLRTDV